MIGNYIPTMCTSSQQLEIPAVHPCVSECGMIKMSYLNKKRAIAARFDRIQTEIIHSATLSFAL